VATNIARLRGRSFTAIPAFTFAIQPPKHTEVFLKPQRKYPEQSRRITEKVHAGEMRQEFIDVKNTKSKQYWISLRKHSNAVSFLRPYIMRQLGDRSKCEI
jgi:hypothetical protein